MPKKIKIMREEEEEELQDDDEEDEEFDELEDIPMEPLIKRERPPKKIKSPRAKEKAYSKRRFAVIAPQPLRIIDTETNEVYGEGELSVLQILTEVLERLERLELNLGSMIE